MTDFLMFLARANLAVAGAILLVLMLRGIVRRRFGSRAAYALWAIAPMSVIGCALPALPLAASPAATVFVVAPMRSVLVSAGAAGAPQDRAGLIFAIWAMGAALSLCLVVWRQHQFVRAAKAGRAGPAVVGAIFPKVVLPADFETRFTDVERRLILTHERTHLAGADARVTGLIALFQCVSWFNPLVHIAAHYARRDQEFACDADVVARFPDDRRAYAEAMLKTQLTSGALPLGCYWPAQSIHPLLERIAMLNQTPPSRTLKLGGVALVAALALGSGYAAWATDGGQPAHRTATNRSAASARVGLTMRLVDDRAGGQKGEDHLASPDGDLWLEPGAPITGDMIAGAQTMAGPDGSFVVNFQLTPDGAQRFATLTRQNVGRRLAILVDGKPVSAPRIQTEMSGGAGQITGRLDRARAKSLAAAINAARSPG